MKMITSIYKLRKEEYAEGARFSFKNAQDLLKVAESAAEMNNIGIASSLSVLAFEELSKSIILYLKSKNNNIPINNLDKYFTCHKTKQEAGIAFFLSLFLNDVENERRAKDVKIPGLNIILLVIIVALAITVSSSIKDKLKIGLNEKRSKKGSLDAIKESGLYVAYNKNLRKWVSPNDDQINEQFEGFRELLSEFSKVIDSWLFGDGITDDQLKHLLDKLGEDIIDKSRMEKLNL